MNARVEPHRVLVLHNLLEATASTSGGTENRRLTQLLAIAFALDAAAAIRGRPFRATVIDEVYSRELLFAGRMKSLCNHFEWVVAFLFDRQQTPVCQENLFWLQCGFWAGRRDTTELLLFRENGCTLPSNIHGADACRFVSAEVGNPEWMIGRIRERIVSRYTQRESRQSGVDPAAPSFRRHESRIRQLKERLPGLNRWQIEDFFKIGYSALPYQSDLILPLLDLIASGAARDRQLRTLWKLRNWLSAVARQTSNAAEMGPLELKRAESVATRIDLDAWLNDKCRGLEKEANAMETRLRDMLAPVRMASQAGYPLRDLLRQLSDDAEEIKNELDRQIDLRAGVLADAVNQQFAANQIPPGRILPLVQAYATIAAADSD